MRALPMNRIPQEWLRFVSAWGLGLAELPAALPASAVAAAPLANATPSLPRLRISGARG